MWHIFGRGLLNGVCQIKFAAILISVTIEGVKQEGVKVKHKRCMIDMCTIGERIISVNNVNLQQVTLVT